MDSARERDEAVVQRAMASDEMAFAALVERYARPILNFIARMTGDPDAAADVAQVVFLRAWSHRRSYRPTGSPFTTWLFQIARNAAIDHLRQSARRPTESLESIGHEVATPLPSPAEASLHAELGQAIATAVARLPEDQRAAFVLAEYHGTSLRDIAAILDCSEKAAENRLYRARLFLREELRDWRTQGGGIS